MMTPDFLRRYRLALATLFPILVLLALITFLPPDGKTRAQWVQFIGRFHPLTIHFPIALILLVPVLEIASLRQKFSYLRLASRFVLALATLAAIVAVFLGWCLARTGSYSGDLITQHMWGGVTFAFLSWICWMLREHGIQPWTRRAYAAGLGSAVLLVSWTGYRGGQISEGQDHLTEYMPTVLRHAVGLPDQEPLVKAEAGSFYLERVQPILSDRCVSCHGPKKQKNNLRLDSYGWLLRGGEHGAVVKGGNPTGSDLFHRVTLSPDQDDFMPKEKKQPLSADQLKILEVWIAAGASGSTPLQAINVPVVAVSAAPVQVSFPKTDLAAIAKAREAIAPAVAKLQSRFPDILNYESRDSSFLVLNASLLGTKFGDANLQAFAPVAAYIGAADFSRTAITDRSGAAIGAMVHLQSLRLAETKVTDATLRALGGLSELKSLNVYGTGVTAGSLAILEKLPKLERLYAGQTRIKAGASLPPSLSGKLFL